MPLPRRKVQATLESTLTPPAQLEPGQHVARTVAAAGNNLYRVTLPNSSTTSTELRQQQQQQQEEPRTILVELASQFRSTVWLKRGGYVLVDLKAAASTTGNLAARENKIDGEIINVVGDEKAWRKAGWWPKEFVKGGRLPVRNADNDEDEAESRVGKMPPGSSDDEG